MGGGTEERGGEERVGVWERGGREGGGMGVKVRGVEGEVSGGSRQSSGVGGGGGGGTGGGGNFVGEGVVVEGVGRINRGMGWDGLK